MKFDPNDSKLTAYALGELEEAEKAEVEAMLAESPEAREAVEEIQRIGQMLSEELQNEPVVGLTQEHREVIEQSVNEKVQGQTRLSKRTVRVGRILLRVAALIVFAFTAWAILTPSAKTYHPSTIVAFEPIITNAKSTPSPKLHQALTQQEKSEREGLLMAQAQEARKSSDFDEAIEKLDQVLAINPNNERAKWLYDDLADIKNMADERRERVKEYTELASNLADRDEERIPWHNLMVYPDNWLEIVEGSKESSPEIEIDSESYLKPFVTREYSFQVQSEPARCKPAPKATCKPRPTAKNTPLLMARNASDRQEGLPAVQPNNSQLPERALIGCGSNNRAVLITGNPDEIAAVRQVISVLETNYATGGEIAEALDEYYSKRCRRGSLDSASIVALRSTIGAVFKNSMTSDEVSALNVDFFMNQPSDVVARCYKLDENEVEKAQNGLREIYESIQKVPVENESYDRIVENPFLPVSENPLSTFSIDVDTASYSNMRRFLNEGTLPPRDSIRIEELINYFDYDYPQPEGDDPFSVNVEIANCPWNSEHRLARVGLKGYEVPRSERPASNLVFLVDVSGSMSPANKLPLLKQGMQMLLKQLDENDRVAIVVYAGASGLVLPSTTCNNQKTIGMALDKLQSGGSTNGGAGIELAYRVAVENFIEGGINRVVLATDGDFNVGVTNRDDLVSLIEEKARTGVFLSVLGFGMGNYKDSTLEKLADKGNGNYAYIDTQAEARKVLVEEMGSTLMTIAKDVKIQIEFNPAKVNGYRLIGYENRVLADRDFNDDTKDAGEIGAGHTVTALYEIVPAGVEMGPPPVDPLKYQPSPTPEATPQPVVVSDEMMTVKLRYKEPDGQKSKLITRPVTDTGKTLAEVSSDFRFASAVASFGMILKDSRYKGDATFASVLDLVATCMDWTDEYRNEFIDLVNKAESITKNQSSTNPQDWYED